MSILVSDTSVIIDLERGGMLETVFKLPYGFAVPDTLYRRELEGHGGEALLNLGLKVEHLTPDELRTVVRHRRANPKLSVPDLYAFALAFHRNWTLLAGDGDLRTLAIAKKLSIHGVLWLLDECATHSIAHSSQLFAALTAIAAHPRCRLPRKEIDQRLAHWKAN